MSPSLRPSCLVLCTLAVLTTLLNSPLALPFSNQATTSSVSRHATQSGMASHSGLPSQDSLSFAFDQNSPRANIRPWDEHMQTSPPARTLLQKTKNLIHNTACMGSCTAKAVKPLHIQRVNPPSPMRLMAPERATRIFPKPSIQPRPISNGGALRIGESSPLSTGTSKTSPPSVAGSQSAHGSQDKGKGKLPLHSPSSSGASSPDHSVGTSLAGPSGIKSHMG